MPLWNGPYIERPSCPACGVRMALVRREPHPQHGLPTDLRTFECMGCSRQQAEEFVSQPAHVARDFTRASRRPR